VISPKDIALQQRVQAAYSAQSAALLHAVQIQNSAASVWQRAIFECESFFGLQDR
jgi:hypothetical protein